MLGVQFGWRVGPARCWVHPLIRRKDLFLAILLHPYVDLCSESSISSVLTKQRPLKVERVRRVVDCLFCMLPIMVHPPDWYVQLAICLYLIANTGQHLVVGSNGFQLCSVMVSITPSLGRSLSPNPWRSTVHPDRIVPREGTQRDDCAYAFSK